MFNIPTPCGRPHRRLPDGRRVRAVQPNARPGHPNARHYEREALTLACLLGAGECGRHFVIEKRSRSAGLSNRTTSAGRRYLMARSTPRGSAVIDEGTALYFLAPGCRISEHSVLSRRVCGTRLLRQLKRSPTGMIVRIGCNEARAMNEYSWMRVVPAIATAMCLSMCVVLFAH